MGVGFLKIHMKNTFNCLSMQKMLEAVLEKCPVVGPWMTSCYIQHSMLWCGSTRLESCSGIQQGDPLGPLAFSLGFHEVVEKVGELVQWQAWYLDDGIMLGSLDQLEKALQLLQADMATRGLQINLQKCELWGTCCEHQHKATRAADHPTLSTVQVNEYTNMSGSRY